VIELAITRTEMKHMFQQFYQPHPALKGFVSYIMIHQVDFRSNVVPKEFIIPPLPEHSLIFYLRDASSVTDGSMTNREEQPPCIVVGPNVDRHHITPGFDHLVVHVCFQPGGLYRLLGIPMNDLLSKSAFEGRALLGDEINELTDRLREADSFLKMKTIVEGFLFSRAHRLKEMLPIDCVLRSLVKKRGLIRIDELASDACLSTRQFERVFRQRIGLPPKYFSRLVRFSHAWIMKERQPTLPWIQIAYECGYFDQMHLIRDFQEFAGANPSAIEAELSKSPVKLFNTIAD
jgi:AraC-like DNA-binding protein